LKGIKNVDSVGVVHVNYNMTRDMERVRYMMKSAEDTEGFIIKDKLWRNTLQGRRVMGR
jgi:hypothetical protein